MIFELLLLASSPAESVQKEAWISVKVIQAKVEIEAMLRDPDSAKFRRIREKRNLVCGEVNSTNGSGGYVGFKPFVVIFEEEDSPKESMVAPGNKFTQKFIGESSFDFLVVYELCKDK